MPGLSSCTHQKQSCKWVTHLKIQRPNSMNTCSLKFSVSLELCGPVMPTRTSAWKCSFQCFPNIHSVLQHCTPPSVHKRGVCLYVSKTTRIVSGSAMPTMQLRCPCKKVAYRQRKETRMPANNRLLPSVYIHQVRLGYWLNRGSVIKHTNVLMDSVFLCF